MQLEKVWDMSKPVFEIRDGKKQYEIFLNGKTKGFSDPAVINHLMLLVLKIESEANSLLPQGVLDDS